MANKRDDEPKKLVSLTKIIIFTLCIVALITLTYAFFVGFNKGIPSDRITGGLEKRDWLYFWGSIIGVIGTTLFAWISWKQNRTLAHINTEQEQQRKKFSELEMAATFYSSIFIERITISENLLQIYMQSTGKIPPSVINIESLHLYLGRKHGSEVIDALTSHEEYGTQYSVICQQSDVAKVTYLIQLRSGHFNSNTAASKEDLDSIDRNTEPSLRLSVNLGLLNPLKIRTVIAGDVVFRLNVEMSRTNRINPFVYDVFDSFLETKEYIYSGNNE